MKLMVSIRPPYSTMVLNGDQKYLYRTRRPTKNFKRILFYEGGESNYKKVIGEAEFLGYVEGTPDEVWAQTGDQSGMSKEEYDRYFKKRKIAVGLKLGDVIRFVPMRDLEFYGIKTAPQSFIYTNEAIEGIKQIRHVWE